jgi:PleD family two-component response regulator
MSSTGPYVTASVGRATVTPLANDLAEKIVCLADMGLYQAKSLGRNRVCTADEGQFDVLLGKGEMAART